MSKFRNVSLLQPDEKVTDEQLATEMKLLANQRAINRLSRRNFLTSASLAVGATGAMAMAGCSSSKVVTVTPITPAPNPTQTPSQIDVMNFALNLEYLEASFYLYVTTGAGLSAADMGTGAGTVTGGAQVSFSDPNVSALAQQLAAEEQAHVELLQAAITFLGGTPVPMPSLNLAALGTVTSDASFLALSRQLEATGTSAYEGGITLFNDGATYLTIAADIHALEAQHEAAIRQFLIAKNITSAAVDSLDVAVAGSSGPTFSTTGGLNAVRTPSQVLQIVYGTPGVTGTTSGGFYPNGMNNPNSALTTS